MLKKLILAALLLSSSALRAGAHATYTGFSGAPGSGGRCASSCHGSGGGTIQISGFPATYAPDQAYVISISHVGGSTIRQFNGSCRIGSGSANAGVISAGTNTVTYSVSNETNGIHLSAQNLDAGTFTWTAPPAGTGDVRLYVAGLQGSSGGANSTLALLSTEEVASVPAETGFSPRILQMTNYPNPFKAETTIAYSLPQAGTIRLEIFDLAGRLLETIRAEQGAGRQQFVWRPAGLPSAVYLCRIHAADHTETRTMMLAR